ncbi:MAG: hypothetical protein ACLR8Y_03930 [Alistipes indistinctus]
MRDRVTLCRIALFLLTATGGGVTANAVRNQLKVKSVSTVTEHMEHLERAGLVAFVPILGRRRAGRPSIPAKCMRSIRLLLRRCRPKSLFPANGFCDHDP